MSGATQKKEWTEGEPPPSVHRIDTELYGQDNAPWRDFNIRRAENAGRSPKERSQERRDLLPQRRVARGEDEVGLQPVHRVPDVVPLGAQHHPMDRLSLQQKAQRVGE